MVSEDAYDTSLESRASGQELEEVHKNAKPTNGFVLRGRDHIQNLWSSKSDKAWQSGQFPDMTSLLTVSSLSQFKIGKYSAETARFWKFSTMSSAYSTTL